MNAHVPQGLRTFGHTPKDGRAADLSKAHSYVIASNYDKDPTYTPYCGRCSGLHRMVIVEPFLWRHGCGAIHDERQVLT